MTLNDWKLYRTDIRLKGLNRLEPGHATWLGSFGYTRDQTTCDSGLSLHRHYHGKLSVWPTLTEMSEAEEAIFEAEGAMSETKESQEAVSETE